MSQYSAKIIPKLRFTVHDRRRLSTPDGPLGRHSKIKKVVTALFKYERLELNYHKADESRGYAERLLSDAIKYGDTHKPTMEMASYWIIDSEIIHKLFKVLAPRYKDYKISYTKLWRAPNIYPGTGRPKCVLELRGNIYPPLFPENVHKKNLIHNVLLEEAKKVYKEKRSAKEGEKTGGTEASANNLNRNENVQVNAAVDGDVSSNLNETKTETENELPVEENVKADSGSESEIKENSEVNSAAEEDLDLNKIKLSEEEKTDFSNKEEKK